MKMSGDRERSPLLSREYQNATSCHCLWMTPQSGDVFDPGEDRRHTVQIDFNGIADYALNTLDYDADFEDDQGAFSVDGYRVFFTRHRDHFVLEVANERLELPRF